jgi:hypothetical protein
MKMASFRDDAPFGLAEIDHVSEVLTASSPSNASKLKASLSSNSKE